MRPRIIAASALAVGLLAFAGLVAAVLAVGGGDGGGGRPAVRVQQGLSVAALAAGGSATDQAQTREVAADSVSGSVTEFTSVAVPYAATGGKGGDLGFGAVYSPAQQFGQTGITVQGFGSASVPADSAVLELNFGSIYYGGIKPYPVPLPYPYEQTEPGSPPVTPIETPAPIAPITEADLQPVIDAIVAQGVARADIDFIASPYYDPYSSSATLRVAVGNVDNLGAIRQAAIEAAAGLQNIQFQYDSVSYTVSDCDALELAAMQAAVDDADARGSSFAKALGVSRGAILGASHYIYSFYGPNPCDPSSAGPYPMGGLPYAEGQPNEVQLIANVSITYAIQ
ncbi:MAG: SIMPL domain-containing protein [Chloroflexi bacterium]|nr:SIMPL domain-containing protein [Chloroflexota bacterium]